MENLIKDITEKVQDYIDEQYDYDDVLVVDKVSRLQVAAVVVEPLSHR